VRLICTAYCHKEFLFLNQQLAEFQYEIGKNLKGCAKLIAEVLRFRAGLLHTLSYWKASIQIRRNVVCECIKFRTVAYDGTPYKPDTRPYNAALRPLVTRRDQLGPVLVRRDPRNLSRVWVLDPDDGSYVEVACSHQERPAISLHEHRLAVAHLRAQGRAQVDEDAIFRAVQQQREVVQEATQRTRSARRQAARTADAARGAPARTTPEPVAPLGDAAGPPGNAEAAYALDPYPVERW